MANLWCDGLARYGGTISHMLNGSSGQAWAETNAAFALTSANPRTGTHCLRETDGTLSASQRARRVFGAALTEVFFGYALYCEALPSEDPGTGGVGNFLARFSDTSNNTQISLYLGTDGRLALYRGTGTGTLLGASTPIIGAGAYQHLEMYAKAGNGTAGAFEVRVDEVTKLNLTGIDTVLSANVEFSQVQFGHDNLGSTMAGYIDRADFFANDTTSDGSGCDTWIGDVKSGVLMVNADTAQADFTKSTGSVGYTLLDEKPPNDSDYIETASSTAESDFELENGPASLSEILTCRPFIRALKDDAGTCTIAPSMISNSVKATVSDQPLTTAAAYYDSNVPVNPNTGVPWTPSELNAALEVVERTA